MKFITFLLFISCTLFAKEQTYVLLGVSIDNIDHKITANNTYKVQREQTYRINYTIGKQYENYRYSANLLANKEILTFVSFDYLYPSMLEGNTDAFIGISIGKAKLSTAEFGNLQTSNLYEDISSFQVGFTSNDMEFGYRHFFMNAEFKNSTYKEVIDSLQSVYIAIT